ncbi:HepA Superfamily II DNA/RNA helicases, SNF2 family [uncultured Caudovirales phage]|uniref:HepA Superfamily II DNA/RNA helicases, SNF2 family n=1 Tax=uncultured Caudovirales phage TaxID=2100421 RepID=A0A6J5RPJ5_9CAUD|nr:HepA Superfamily II DNA/RNA helicases, SNF2 family [uncultured Caudovirales phage]CAB4205512.1 HepA Superfamily II DNA/RNA helicases, SNF2 family [uncultured Caudovirales phage]CAB4221668.1 HepA Superfamily II DNA/RNA helicases, SNF2 family [uncultured Caudovirales phage]
MQGKTLIIAPKRVAETVWDVEIKKWEHLSHLTVSKILGNEKVRLEACKQKVDIYIINLENVAWLCETPYMNQFDNLVIDESSRFKDSSTKRFKALKKYLKGFSRRIILTGTPTPQGLPDLWSQIGILDLGTRLETSLTKFRDKYLMPDQMNYHTKVIYSWKLQPGADKLIQDKVSDICFSLKADDYLQLPKLTALYHTIDVDKQARTQYEQLRKDMVAEIGKEKITAPTAATLANKLLQFTSGAVYNEDGEAQEVHRSKLEYLESIMEESSSPALVFYHFKHSLQRLRLQFPQAVVLDDDNIETWRRGEIRMLLAHPQSGGIGLNLQCNAGDTAQTVWFDLPWSSENYIQANARIYRQGQEKPVIIHHLTMSNSIDQHVVKVLEGKINIQEALLDALKSG